MEVVNNYSLIRKRLEENINEGKKSMAAYLMLGYPDLKTSTKAMIELTNLGVDIIEIGFPFSDPTADGPVIQAAGATALKKGVTLDDLWDVTNKISKETNSHPLVMTYGNIPFQYGFERFVQKGLSAGLQGVIFPDIPPKHFPKELNQLKPIYLASPLTNDQRLVELVNSTTGFLYLISHLGITGDKSLVDQRLVHLVSKVKKINSDVPVMLGFGISDDKGVANAMKIGVDGVIVGSALIKALGTEGNLQKLRELTILLKKELK